MTTDRVSEEDMNPELRGKCVSQEAKHCLKKVNGSGSSEHFVTWSSSKRESVVDWGMAKQSERSSNGAKRPWKKSAKPH